MKVLPVALLAIACSPSRPAPTDRASEDAASINLAIRAPFSELRVPNDSRDGEAPSEVIPLRGWRRDGTEGAFDLYEVDVPYRTRALFFVEPPAGLTVQDSSGAQIPFRRRSEGPGPSFALGRHRLVLRVPTGDAAPADDAYRIVWESARERSARLNFAFSGLESAEDFVRSRAWVDRESWEGLLLPAPAAVAWRVEIPEAAELTFTPGLVLPEIAVGEPSDGARLRIDVEDGETTTTVWDRALPTSSWTQARIDLSAWSGQTVTLRAETDPVGTSRFDYAFLAEPILASRTSNPRQVALIFIDTLRPDHMSVYGYERDTTPHIKDLADRGFVFEQARSVAPWTLPSTRSIISGRRPEEWDPDQTLQRAARQAGFATGLFAGNMYLSTGFDIHHDWGRHRVLNRPSATEQTDQALAWWSEHDGHDRLLLIHYMDPHLPYEEPASYRRKYAGEPVKPLGEYFLRKHVSRLQGRPPGPLRKYVVDRYDNNVAYTDDEIGRLVRGLGPDTLVAIVSDHGEEFWEHGKFEHGHSLFDELLRVPFVLSGPGVPKGRSDASVSVLDLTPTLLDLLGLQPVGSVRGSSLKPLFTDTTEPFDNRALAFADPLYGMEQWGSLKAGQKYVVLEGREALYDLRVDPGEKKNLLIGKTDVEAAPHRDAFEEATGRALRVTFRFVNRRPPKTDSGEPLIARVHVPGGIKAAWLGSDPNRRMPGRIAHEGEGAIIEWASGRPGYREAYILPSAPIEEVLDQLEIVVTDGVEEVILPIREGGDKRPGVRRVPLGRKRTSDERGVMIAWGIAPIPREGQVSTDAYDPEMVEMLKAAGYLSEDDEAP